MKNYIPIIILTALFISNNSIIAQEKINQLDNNGKRTGAWEKYYNNKRIRYTGQFEAGKEIGVFKFYSALNSDHPIAIKTFDKSSSIAEVKFYTEVGILESSGHMDDKKRVGKWLYYHEDGETIMSEENYVDGKLNGEAKTFYKSGEITEILYYSKGKLHGNAKRYDIKGALVSDLTYENGKLHGLAKYFNIDGELMYTGNYENDVKTGKWEYYENGEQKNVNKLKQ
jgi:antitoxin component YwqK of YwqJK toxin-antitoxin module